MAKDGAAPSEGAIWMAESLQDVSMGPAELAGVEARARELNDRTRALADAAPALADPTGFAAALARKGR